MDIEVLGCFGGMDGSHRLTSFLVNGSFAVDAGGITDALSFERQLAIKNIFITHAHFDHTGTLPFLVDNRFGNDPLRVYGPAELLGHIHRHIFNDIMWPDFTVLPSPDNPSLQLIEVPVGKPFEIQGLEVTAVWVNHVVPTVGIIVSEEGRSWIYPSDTSDTDDIWKVVNGLPDPRLLFLECSYPNRFQKLADESKHLTPRGVGRQLDKVRGTFPVRVYHFKPIYLDEIREELGDLNHPDLQPIEQGKVYTI